MRHCLDCHALRRNPSTSHAVVWSSCFASHSESTIDPTLLARQRDAKLLEEVWMLLIPVWRRIERRYSQSNPLPRIGA